MQNSTIKINLEDFISREKLIETLGVSDRWCTRREKSLKLTKIQEKGLKKGKVFYLRSEVEALFEIINASEEE